MQDLFLNETAKFAHVFLPGTSFLEKDGTFTNAERRINRVRPVMAPKTGKHEWQIVCEIATAMGYPMDYDHPSQIMDEIAARHADVRRRVLRPARQARQRAVAVQRLGTRGDAGHARRRVRPRQGQVRASPRTCRPTSAAPGSFPLILTTGRILSQYNVGAQTRRTANVAWHPEDVLEMHPHDAEVRGIARRRRW